MLTSSQLTSNQAANDPDFIEDVRDLSEKEIFQFFLGSPDKSRFLSRNSLRMRKYMRVFLVGYNTIPQFEEKYGDIFFSSTNSNYLKGIISVFLITRGFRSEFYIDFLFSLSPEHKKEIIQFFQHSLSPDAKKDHFAPLLQQLRTQETYERIGLKRVK